MKPIGKELNAKNYPIGVKDANGNIIYTENENGFWTRYEYDDKGREIYYEDSDGDWEQRGYSLIFGDDNRNIKQLKKSNGLYLKFDYDLDTDELICVYDSGAKNFYYLMDSFCHGEIIKDKDGNVIGFDL